jgi:BMFP domain-containing protein YqiC
MLTQMRNKIDTLETHVDELEAKLDALLEVLA